MFYIDKMLGDEPIIFFVGDPVLFVEARKIDRGRVAAQCFKSFVIKIFMEVGEDELADGAIDWFAITEDDVIGF